MPLGWTPASLWPDGAAVCPSRPPPAPTWQYWAVCGTVEQQKGVVSRIFKPTQSYNFFFCGTYLRDTGTPWPLQLRLMGTTAHLFLYQYLYLIASKSFKGAWHVRHSQTENPKTHPPHTSLYTHLYERVCFHTWQGPSPSYHPSEQTPESTCPSSPSLPSLQSVALIPQRHAGT